MPIPSDEHASIIFPPNAEEAVFVHTTALNKRHGRLFLAGLFAQFLRGERDLKSKIAYRRRVCSCVPGCFLLIRLDCGMFTQLMDNPINGCPPSNAPDYERGTGTRISQPRKPISRRRRHQSFESVPQVSGPRSTHGNEGGKIKLKRKTITTSAPRRGLNTRACKCAMSILSSVPVVGPWFDPFLLPLHRVVE